MIQEPLTFLPGEYAKHGHDVPCLVIGGKRIVIGPTVFILYVTFPHFHREYYSETTQNGSRNCIHLRPEEAADGGRVDMKAFCDCRIG